MAAQLQGLLSQVHELIQVCLAVTDLLQLTVGVGRRGGGGGGGAPSGPTSECIVTSHNLQPLGRAFRFCRIRNSAGDTRRA